VNTNQQLHGDLIGPFEVPSKAGNRYAYPLTDGFSCYTKLYLLKCKSDATEATADFIQELGNLHNISIKIMHFDNGGKFVNKSMKKETPEI
jgi:hypothetical protein